MLDLLVYKHSPKGLAFGCISYQTKHDLVYIIIEKHLYL